MRHHVGLYLSSGNSTNPTLLFNTEYAAGHYNCVTVSVSHIIIGTQALYFAVSHLTTDKTNVQLNHTFKSNLNLVLAPQLTSGKQLQGNRQSFLCDRIRLNRLGKLRTTIS